MDTMLRLKSILDGGLHWNSSVHLLAVTHGFNHKKVYKCEKVRRAKKEEPNILNIFSFEIKNQFPINLVTSLVLD